ncbi:MAG TPA: hypothetical protein VMZ28_08450 [Kofleriaceae bacterium]|nr:hypothetical protein [Kofleriaceae bacterium]
MNHNHTSVRRGSLTATLAAFGVASLSAIGVASADPRPYRDRDRDGLADRYEDDRGYQYDDYDEYQVGPYGQYQGDTVDTTIYVDLDRYAPAQDFSRVARVDFRRFDRNRNGRLESWEREAYWRTLADQGVFGRRAVAQPVADLAKHLDRDGDGRLTRREVMIVRRFIAARRMFEAQDRDNDDRLWRGEATGWIWNHFAMLDTNRDRKVTRSEVKQHFIRMDGERPRTWSWRSR